MHAALLDPLISDFLSYLTSERGLSPNTLSAYRRDLVDLHQFLLRAERPWPPKDGDLEAYAIHLHGSGLQTSSQARKLTAIKLFVRFLFREGHIEKNISKVIESPKRWQKIPSTLDYREIDQLVQAPNLNLDEGIRDRAIFELLYGTGIRVSELCGLSLYDVMDDAIRVRGKGNRERLVPIGVGVLACIDRYLSEVRMKYDSEKNEALFVTRRGGRIGREFVWKQVRKYAKMVGIQKNVSPHVLRHTYASHLLDGGADVRVIQDLLGHAHISSTDRYTHVSKSQMQERFYAHHPRWDE